MPWFSLNAYGVLLGFLSALAGVRYFVDPTGFLLAGTGHAGYIVAGVALVVAYWRIRVDIEVYASTLLLGANILVLLSQLFGSLDLTVFGVATTSALAVAVVARVRALTKGGTFCLPTWRR